MVDMKVRHAKLALSLCWVAQSTLKKKYLTLEVSCMP